MTYKLFKLNNVAFITLNSTVLYGIAQWCSVLNYPALSCCGVYCPRADQGDDSQFGAWLHLHRQCWCECFSASAYQATRGRCHPLPGGRPASR